MGTAFAQLLAGQGVELVGYDVDPSRYGAVAPYRVRPACDPGHLAAECDAVLLALPNSQIASEVLLGKGGVHEGARPGTLVIDTTTGEPQIMADLARKLHPGGIAYLDATVGGNSEELTKQQVLFMVGGDPDAFRRAEPLLRLMSPKLFYMGESGKGAEAKLIFNLVLGLHRAVLAEALHLGAQAGIDAGRLLELLRGGGAYSRVMDAKGEKMVSRTYQPPVAKLAQHLKDVRLIVEMGHRLDAPLPLSALHAQILQAGVSQGMGSWDNAAVFEVYRSLSGTRDV